ncbi:hypothetical protein CAPTEDRAFT_100001 [Capitella teleta]|uniref:Cytochrome P450 n=1 Tax=Capitella teleta TaxID=283909 RepID=R7UI47_CAPTE|nr:hypothetical protein CAPTEDRAFT_100001 [Capitella teleta]|eukprot:ELU02917.1 hypothetical protein CAPTEDRAFT_100001 [Capitella teleta]
MTVVYSLVAITLSAIWIWWKGRGPTSKECLPHYRGWPVFGNLFQVRRERSELTFSEWTKDLGPVFSVKLLHNRFVVLSSFEAIYEALVTKGNSFSGRPTKNAFRAEVISEHFSSILHLQANQTWKKLRMICHKKIKMYDTGMKRIEAISMNIIQFLVEEFKGTNQTSFNPKDVIYNTVMNTMMTLLLGKTFTKDEELFEKVMEFEQGAIRASSPSGRGVELDVFPWLRFFGNKTYKTLKRLVELKKQVWEIMTEEASRGDLLLKEGEEDVRLVSALRDALAEEGSGLTEKHLRSVITNDIVIGGTATTSSSLYLFLNIISRHRAVQMKLQEEVDRIVGSDRTVCLTDKADMPYTQATQLELLRYSSVAPLTLPHTSLEDIVIQGKTVPAGSNVLVNLYHMHHDEDFWENPFEFQPERFLGDDGGVVPASHPNRRHLMPFGAGPRVCLGEALAKSRLFLVIASLMQKFDILPGAVSAPCDPRLLEHGLVLSSAPFQIIANERLLN